MMTQMKQNVRMAVAVAAVVAMSGAAALGQASDRRDAGAGRGGAGSAGSGPGGSMRQQMQPGPSGGTMGRGGGMENRGSNAPQRGPSGGTMGRGGGTENRGSNARGAQGPERMTPGDRGSNMRGTQGPERSRSGTTGQRQDRMERNTGQGRSERFDQGRERPGTTGQGGVRTETDRTRSETGSRSNTRSQADVNISADQRTRIRDIVVGRRDIPRVNRADFDVRVGTVIPRTVRLVSLPEDVVRIYPRFRRHRVFIVGNEIVIVDPATLQIVAVLPA